MSRLRFLSPDAAAPGVARSSPLARAALGPAVSDADGLGKLEVRGAVETLVPSNGEQVLPLGPGRILLVCEHDVRAAQERLAGEGFRVYDMTSALAAFDVEGEPVLRRLTDLDPGSLPAVGSVARGTPALIERRGEGERFRLYVPRELAHYVAEVAADAAAGVAR